MLDFVFIFIILIVILTLFYKQSHSEFRINQIEWKQRDQLQSLLHEKLPCVLRSLPKALFWTHQDVLSRSCYHKIPVFKETSLPTWISTTKDIIECPWNRSQAKQIASYTGIHVFANTLHPHIFPPYLSWWIYHQYYCWAGNKGLHKTIAGLTTCIFPVDGEIILSFMPNIMEPFLPYSWQNTFPSQYTIKDTPFITDLKFMDIIIRPGTCVFIPPHWFISWTSSQILPMVCTISYETPPSLLSISLNTHLMQS